MIEGQVQRLLLPAGQARQRTTQRLGRFISLQRHNRWRRTGRFGGSTAAEPKPLKPVPALMIQRGGADDCKEPGLKARSPLEACFASQHLQIHLLQNLFRLMTIAHAAAQRPAEIFGVERLKLFAEVKVGHGWLADKCM